MAPTPQQLAVAIDALSKAGFYWEDHATTAPDLAAKVDGLAYSATEGGVFAAFIGPYNQVRTAISDRCKEGKTEMTSIGETLRAAASTYAIEEARNEHSFRDLY